jgi:hypothetical protein
VSVGVLVGVGGEWRRLGCRYMVSGVHILTWSRIKKTLAITLSGAGSGLRGREIEVVWSIYNIKLIGTVTMNLSLYNEYILIKIFIIKNK